MDDQKRDKGPPGRWSDSWGLAQAVLVCSDGVLTTALPDFEKTFIQCIVYNFDVLKEYKDEASLKAAGKVMTKGKDYVVEVGYVNSWKESHLMLKQDGDIILVKAGAAKS